MQPTDSGLSPFVSLCEVTLRKRAHFSLRCRSLYRQHFTGQVPEVLAKRRQKSAVAASSFLAMPAVSFQNRDLAVVSLAPLGY
jgi:hypothetical protein